MMIPIYVKSLKHCLILVFAFYSTFHSMYMNIYARCTCMFTSVCQKKTYAVTWKLFVIENRILIWIESIPAFGSWVSWVDTIRDLSLEVRVTDRQTRFSSLPWRFRTTVNRRTGWASAITLNLSTQNQVEKVIPDWGGNILSPEKK